MREPCEKKKEDLDLDVIKLDGLERERERE